MNQKPNQTNLSAIILAGGRSSRMDTDKALITVQQTPMLQLVYNAAETCTDKIYIVTPWQERYQHLSLPSCKFIREVQLDQPHGPLIGFALGLAHVETDWVLLLACDLPKLRKEILQQWAAKLNQVPEEAIAFLPQSNKGWDPLCGFYRRNCLSSLGEFIEQGGRSFQKWLNQQPVETLPLEEPEMLFNCNTPSDLKKIQTPPS